MAPVADATNEQQGLAHRNEQQMAAMPTFGGVQMRQALSAYKELQRALDEEMPDAIMKLDGKPYRKKGYWRAVAVAFNLNVEPIEEKYEERGKFEDGRPNFGYVITYRATMPNGRTTTGDGACFAVEKAKRFKCPHPHASWEGKTAHWPPENCPDFDPAHAWKSLPPQSTDHNIRGHAHTRAYNRAVSNLVGFGEVSAEEVSRDEHVVEGEVVQSTSTAQTKFAGSGATSGASTTGTAAKKDAKEETELEGVAKVRSAPDPAEGKPMRVTMDNGMSGSTFDTAIQELAKAALASGAPRHYRFEKKGKYTNLMELKDPAPQAVSDEELAKPDPEVVETVLVTRQVAGTEWHVVQGSEREYVTNNADLVVFASDARVAKPPTRFVAQYEKKRSQRPGMIVRQLTGFRLMPDDAKPGAPPPLGVA